VTRRCSIFCYPLRLPRTPKMEPQVAVQLNSRRQTERDSQDICSATLELRPWDYLSLQTPKAQGPRFEHCASPQPSGPILSAAGVHLEVRIAAELLDADEDASEALRLALFSTAVISPLPGKGNGRRQFIT
jgi:hypothetical protein